MRVSFGQTIKGARPHINCRLEGHFEPVFLVHGNFLSLSLYHFTSEDLPIVQCQFLHYSICTS